VASQSSETEAIHTLCSRSAVIEIEFQLLQCWQAIESVLAQGRSIRLDTTGRPSAEGGVAKIIQVYAPFTTLHILSVLDELDWRSAHLRQYLLDSASDEGAGDVHDDA
jgi:hypothetical protein